MHKIVSIDHIENIIYFIRGQKIMLDEDLALLYGVNTGVLNRAVKRNSARFPASFAFRLTADEWSNLKCQIGISSLWGGRRRGEPHAFTEHGAVMLSSVLRSKHAVKMSIEVVEAFVRLRRSLASNQEIEKQLHEVKSFILKQTNKNDREFRKVWQAIEKLATRGEDSDNGIGFKV